MIAASVSLGPGVKATALTLLVLPVALFFYAYVLYPLVLWIIARWRPAATSRAVAYEPSVTVVLPAYNEASQIRGAVEALLNQDYPLTRTQILVVSDASTDETDAIVQGFAARGVELVRMPSRVGKTAAENAAVRHISGDIVVNTDASVRLHRSAIRQLVQAMVDDGVGVASTRDISVGTATSAPASESNYVGYEMWIRRLETHTGGIVGASGSGYAIRRVLHERPVREDLSRDFSAALTARRQGFRAVSVEDAICYVPRTSSLRREYRRKVRTVSRGMETLFHNRDLLSPIRHGGFAWKLFSHKAGRWLVPLAVLPGNVGAAVLVAEFRWVAAIFFAEALFLAMAILSAAWPESKRPPRGLVATLLGILGANLAVLHAFWRFVHGRHDHVWEPTRRTAPNT